MTMNTVNGNQDAHKLVEYSTRGGGMSSTIKDGSNDTDAQNCKNVDGFFNNGLSQAFPGQVVDPASKSPSNQKGENVNGVCHDVEFNGKHQDTDHSIDDQGSTGGWSGNCFCWGTYEAPEARPWVLMHAVVGICVIHFSIAISQAILYTASAVANSSQRMPMLFNIRAGNTQIALNIIVSIINFVLLPTIGAISDYTRYRYHLGCLALIAVVCSEFVSCSASQQVPARPQTPPNTLPSRPLQRPPPHRRQGSKQ
jgi:hypothetical protein